MLGTVLAEARLAATTETITDVWDAASADFALVRNIAHSD
jgi:hypothetical protein